MIGGYGDTHVKNAQAVRVVNRERNVRNVRTGAENPDAIQMAIERSGK